MSDRTPEPEDLKAQALLTPDEQDGLDAMETLWAEFTAE